LEELSPMYRAALRPPARAEGKTRAEPGGNRPDEAAVLTLLDDPEPVQLDVLADRVPFGIGRLQAALFGSRSGRG